MRFIGPKFPEIPVQNRMEQKFSGNSIRKFRSSRPFSQKFGNSGNFLFHWAFPPSFVSLASLSRPKRWQQQAFSPAKRMLRRFTRLRITSISMTYFNVNDDTFCIVLRTEVSLGLVQANISKE